ncbi:MAG: bifunctional ornithine acetyltransferase/N-acetylglutamate synthase [Methanotrichaceae archaeon]
MKKIDGGICAIEGVRACGLKRNKYGLAAIAASGAAAGVFTTNKIRAAPLDVTKLNLEGGQLDGIIANSGCANAYTGSQGIDDAKKMAGLFASHLGTSSDKIGVASTGVIGQRLDLELINEIFEEIKQNLRNDPKASQEATKAIMTTDTVMKEVAVEHKGIKVAGIAKGSGMIEPQMATMLSFLYTDADLSPEVLRHCLTEAVEDSFNMLIVDGDTSTNDMVLVTSTGKVDCDLDVFKEALGFVCVELTKIMARDGEGATKYVETVVAGAASQDDARKAARTIMRSNLVKTAIFGEDPNWGRIVAALGRSGAELDPDLITLSIRGSGQKMTLVERGEIVNGVLDRAEEIMKSDELAISLDLGLGRFEAKCFGCDMGYDYVKINSEYTS